MVQEIQQDEVYGYCTNEIGLKQGNNEIWHEERLIIVVRGGLVDLHTNGYINRDRSAAH